MLRAMRSGSSVKEDIRRLLLRGFIELGELIVELLANEMAK